MKSRFRALLIAATMVPLLFFSSVAAVEGSSTDSNTSNTTTQSSQTDDDKLTVQQRLDKRKAELKIKLTALEQSRIKLKCKASQGLLSSLSGRIKGIETSRNNVYKELTDRLTDLTSKLKNQGVDTTELNTEIDALNAKIATFKTDLDAYKLAVSDLSGMDCASDPTAFKSSLLAARSAHDKVTADALAVRNYVNETIKPTLQKIRQQLEQTKSGGTQ